MIALVDKLVRGGRGGGRGAQWSNSGGQAIITSWERCSGELRLSAMWHVTWDTSHVTCDIGHMTCDTWHVTHDIWHMTCAIWHVTHDMWHMTCDMWHMSHDMWHVTGDMWHVTCDTWRELNILSKFQVPSSYGLGVKVSWRFGQNGSVRKSVNESQRWL